MIVDDGSTDSTADLARRWVQKDGRIRLVQHSNQGVSAARNRGLLDARSDWVAFLDSDDWLALNFLRVMTRALRAQGVDSVVCSSANRAADGRQDASWHPPSPEDFFPTAALRCPYAVHSAVDRVCSGWVQNDTLSSQNAFPVVA